MRYIAQRIGIRALSSPRGILTLLILFGLSASAAAQGGGGASSAAAALKPVPVSDALEQGKDVAWRAFAVNKAVADAWAAGAAWPADPIRVALAYLELQGAPNTVITRTDDRAESATHTKITVIEDGFLDDSVSGLEQYLTLELVDGVWRITGYQGLWRCGRGDRATVPLSGRCP